MTQFNTGDEIETTVVQVSGDTVFIDLGLKSEGFVDKADFTDENGNCTVKEGDKVIYSKYSGTEVKVDEDEEYIIVSQSDILAIIK